MSTNKRRSSRTAGEFLMFLAGGMFCLILITTAMMGGLLARYTTENQGTDSARVAKWDVDVQGPEDDVEIEYLVSPNDQGAYTVTIENKSEVAVTYSMTVEVEEVDFDIQVELEGKKLSTVESTTLKFPNIGSLPAGGTINHDLVFSVVDWGEFTKFVAQTPSRRQELEFTVTVDVVQVD